MSLETLKTKVEQLIEKAQSSEEDTLGMYLTKTLTRVRNENITQFTDSNMFKGQSNLVSADFPNLVRTNDNVFNGCTKLEYVNLPKANYIGGTMFAYCESIESVNYPCAATVYTGSFKYATKLKLVDIGVTTNFVRTEAFIGCTVFDTLILRGDAVSTLSNINNFNGGAFAEGASGGTIYVPSALIESYKTATNWSVLYEAGRCNFVAIEGSEYE